MKILNLKTGELEELPSRILTKEGYLGSGTYYKYASDLTFGEQGGLYWWSLSPHAGRFEYRYLKGMLTLMEGFSVPVEYDYLEKYKFRYDGYGFEFITDLIIWIYLHNEHDFSEKDMAYRFGKRKYCDELVKL